jgi:hypothetical protein
VDSMANYDRELGDENAEHSDFGWTAPRHLTGMSRQLSSFWGNTSDLKAREGRLHGRAIFRSLVR